MNRTEFYQKLGEIGKGKFLVTKEGAIRTKKLYKNPRTGLLSGHSPLSYVAWRLHGVKGVGEVDRPAKALKLRRSALRLFLSSEYIAGMKVTSRKAMLTVLGLEGPMEPIQEQPALDLQAPRRNPPDGNEDHPGYSDVPGACNCYSCCQERAWERENNDDS